ncbi:stage II sporulation protein M [Proteinivorax hydrogeniformans]|uniref:Stage II sporulation protein M n=1 Tax=Proteinivorax hydrogeniformans TaxID=1826727 RepID=A0AAU8HQI7_9FIRM
MPLKYLIGRYIKENAFIYYFLTLILVLGIAFGAVMVNRLPSQHSEPLVDELQFYFEVLEERPDLERQELLWQSFNSNARFVIICWLLGLTIIGIPIVVFMVFSRGMVLGFSVAFLFEQASLRGLVFSILAILPQNLLVLPGILIASVASLSFSWVLIMKVVKNKNIQVLPHFRNYSVLCAVTLLIMLIAALVEAYITPAILRLIVPMMI